MALFSKSDRVVGDPLNRTEERVGPGVYHPKPTLLRQNSEGFAPFGKLMPRETIIEEAANKQQTPSPGTYHPRDVAARKIPDGPAFSRMSERFKPKRSIPKPDPTSYNVLPERQWNKAYSLKPSFRQGKTTNLPSSIPAQHEWAGYVVDDSGSLVKNKLVGPSSGPYIPPNTLDKRGGVFGKLSEKRVLSTTHTKEGPAPGTYDHEDDDEASNTIPPLRKPPPSFLTTEKRSVGPQLNPEMLESPGPAAYSTMDQSDFALKPSPAHQFFGSTTDRFLSPAPVAPPPGTYEHTKKSTLNLKNMTVSDVRSPFGQSTPRFNSSGPDLVYAPGPCSYNLPPAIDTTKHIKASIPFGTTGRRTGPMVSKERFYAPGPGAYEELAVGSPRRPATSGPDLKKGFLSSTPRMVGSDTLTPAANTYHVSHSLDLDPPLPKTRLTTAPFLSGAKRFQKDFQVKARDAADPSVPPPNSYDPSLPLPNTGGRLPDHKKERFDMPDTFAPPPNKYNIAEPFSSSVFKKSYNAAVKKEGQEAVKPSPNSPPKAFLLTATKAK